MHVANMKLLVDVGELAACVLQEEFADEYESACEEVEEQSSEEDGKRPCVLVEKKRTIWN
jgi:hypothetical protein